eukprot:TRINITY_DN2326_c2_g2_i4.p1 TRINITY_DN2326_c2_g2~~TRINITY_DN2326_c2_g2_i4.p1  ORF type:complete len:1748 (+),score=357.71 TRINITY_DN2326_c2_g2_i4:77-5320(+)
MRDGSPVVVSSPDDPTFEDTGPAGAEELSQESVIAESLARPAWGSGPRRDSRRGHQGGMRRSSAGQRQRQRQAAESAGRNGTSVVFPKRKSRISQLAADVPSAKLLACVPRQLLRRLVETCYEPVAGYEIHSSALLFVDISGFSAVAHALNEVGSSEGAEMLSHHLNQYFARLLRVVRQYGGDVVLFSGDAMMVSWPNEQGVGGGVDLAVRCSDTILREVGEYSFSISAQGDRSPRRCTMNIHMGLALGDVACLIVGGSGSGSHGAWRYIVGGAAVEAAGVASNAATNGQLVCGTGVLDTMPRAKSTDKQVELRGETQTFQLFDGFADDSARELPRASVTQDLDEETDELRKRACSLFVFDTLVDAMASGRAGELRTVSTVFIRLSGIDAAVMESDSLHSKLDEAFQVIQRHLTKADGVVNKLVMDDKGVICLCLFGIPRHVHEDDAERSVHFSLKVSRRIGKAIGGVSIGISRAKVFCGLTGDDWRLEYTVLGDGVNLAARLMQQAQTVREQHIMCDYDTRRECKSGEGTGLQFAPAEDLMLKGRDTPLTCFHVVREGDRNFGGAPSPSQSPRAGSPHPPGRLCLVHSASVSSFSSAGSSRSFRSTTSSRLSLVSSNSIRRSIRSPQMREILSPSPRNLGSGRMSLSPSNSPEIVLPSPGRGDPGPGDAATRSSCTDLVSAASDGLSSAGSVRHQEGGLVGREEELSLFRSLMEQHLQPRGPHRPGCRPVNAWNSGSYKGSPRTREPTAPRCIHISGPSQSGKTALLTRAMELATGTGAAVLCLSGDLSSSEENYGAVRGAVRRLIVNADVQAVEAFCMPEERPLLSLLHYVVRAPQIALPDEDLMKLSSERKVASINDILLSMFRNHFGWPMLLLVDDAQWIDGMTWTFLQSAHAAGVATIVAGRDWETGRSRSLRNDGDGNANSLKVSIRRSVSIQPDSASVGSSSSEGDATLAIAGFPAKIGRARYTSQVLSSPEATKLVLGPVSRSAMRALVTGAVGCDDADETAVKFLEVKSGGVPGTAIQMVAGLMSSGGMTLLPDSFVMLTPGAQLDEMLVAAVPGVETQVMRAVDQISDALRRVLTVACVLAAPLPGASFSLQLAREVFMTDWEKRSKGEAPDFTAMIDSLLAERWLVTDREGVLTFPRPITADVIYRTSLAADRRRLHSLAAQAVQSKPSFDSYVLASHHKRAGEQSELLAAATRAFEAQVRRGRLAPALTLLHDKSEAAEALGSQGTGDERAGGLLDLAQCSFETGDVATAARLCSESPFKLRRRRRRGWVCVCCRAESSGEDEDDVSWRLRIQAVVLMAETQLLRAEPKGLADYAAELSRLATARGADPLAAVVQQTVSAMRACIEGLSGTSNKFPQVSVPRNMFDVCSAFAGWDASKSVGLITRLPQAQSISLECVSSVQEPDIRRPSVFHGVLSLGSVFCLLSGEGPAAIKFAAQLHTSACRIGDGRSRAYAAVLRTLASCLYTEEIVGKSSDSQAVWSRAVWRKSERFRLRTATGLGRLADRHELDAALGALAEAARLQLWASVCSITPVATDASGVTALSVQSQSSVPAVEEAVVERALRRSLAVSGLVTPFQAAAAVLAAEAVVRITRARRAGRVVPTSLATVLQVMTENQCSRAIEAARAAAQRYPVLTPSAEFCEGSVAADAGDTNGAREHWGRALTASDKLGLPFALHATRARAALLLIGTDRSPDAGTKNQERSAVYLRGRVVGVRRISGHCRPSLLLRTSFRRPQ